HQTASLAYEEMAAAVGRRDRDQPPEEIDDRVMFRVHPFVALSGKFVGSVEQERAKDVNNPLELLNQRRANRDENPTHDNSAEDAPKQDFVLILRGNFKVAKDN